MRVRSLVVVGAVLVGLAAFAVNAPAQSPDPWIGTWKVNVAKSKYSPGPAPKSSTMVIAAADGGIKVTNDTVPATGAATHTEITAKLDGKDAPMKGNPNVDTSAFTKIDAETKAEHLRQVVRNRKPEADVAPVGAGGILPPEAVEDVIEISSV